MDLKWFCSPIEEVIDSKTEGRRYEKKAKKET